MTTNTIRADRDNRKDVWEHRSTPVFEIRSDGGGACVTLTGYASTFEPYEMYGGPEQGGWIEQISPRAFSKTLRESPDVHLLINHEGMPLARTKSGTLQLSADKHGLKVTAQLDPLDPDAQRLVSKMQRGDMDEMSFAFRVRDQEWDSTPEFEDDPYALRTITEVSLHKGDVSVVNFGANPTTSAELKSVDQALALLAECDPRLLSDIRSDSELLRRARAALNSVRPKEHIFTDVVGKVALEQARTAAAASEAADKARAANELLAASRANTDDKPKGMSFREAMARQGFASEDGSVLSLDDALAVVDE